MKRHSNRRTRLFLTTALVGGAFYGAAAHAQMLPSGPVATAPAGVPGAPVISLVNGANPSGVDGTDMDVALNSNRTVINWNSFNVGSTNTVTFKNGSTSSADLVGVLNRDLSGNMSFINGQLLSDPNISVYLMNTAGITFGNGANVNVGALIAGALNLDAAQEASFLAGSDSLTFTVSGASTRGVRANAGSTINTSAGIAGLGQLVLLGAFVDAAGSQTGRDVAFVAGTDIVMNAAAGSPLNFVINRGTRVTNAITVGGTVAGRNVTLALARQSDAIDSVLGVSGMVTAVTASPTDRGIVLSAGTSASGVTITPGADTSGGADIALSGTLQASGPGGNVEIRSLEDFSGSVPSRVDAEGAVAITSLTGAIAHNGVTRSGGDTSLTAGLAMNLGQAAQVGGDYSVTAQNFTGAALAPAFAGTGNDFTIVDTAGGLTLGAISAPGTLTVTAAGGGALTVSGALASNGEDIALSTLGGGNLVVDAAVGGGAVNVGIASSNDLTINPAGSVTATGTATLAATRNLVARNLTAQNAALTAGGLLNLVAPIAVAEDLVMSAADFAGVALSTPFVGAGDDLTINDTAGGLTLAGPIAANGMLAVNVLGGGALAVNGTLTSLTESIALTTIGGGAIALGADLVATTAGQNVTLNSSAGISQAAGVIRTETLNGSAAGGAVLTANNEINNLGAFSANGLNLNDVGGLATSGLVEGGVAGVTLTTSGDLTTNAGITSDGGPITLTATGPGSDILLNNNVNASAGPGPGSGSVVLAANGAGGTISQSGSGVITAGTLTGSSNGATTLTAATNQVSNLGNFSAGEFGFANGPSLNVTGAVTGSTAASISAGANLVIAPAGSVATAGTASLAAGGDLTLRNVTAQHALLTAGGTLTVAAPLNVSEDMVMTAVDFGGVALSGPFAGLGDDLTINDTAGGLTLASPLTANGLLAINVLGGGTLAVNGNLSSTTESIALATAGGGDIALGANLIALTPGQNVTLVSSGAISQSAGVVRAETLTGSAVNSAALTRNNEISNLGSFSANGLTLNDIGGLTTTGAVDGGSTGVALNTSGDLVIAAGVASNGGIIGLTATGAGSDVLLNSAVNAGAGSVALTANGGTISQNGSGAITAAALTGSSGGTTTLTAAANQIASLGNFSANGLTLSNGRAMVVNGAANGGAGGVTITNAADISLVAGSSISAANSPIALAATGAGSDIVLGGTVNAGSSTVTLTANGAGGTITQDAAGVITAATLTGSSSGATNLLAASNQVSNLAVFTANGFGLRTAGPLVVAGDVNSGPGDLELRTDIGGLALNSNLDAGGTVRLLVGGAISQNSGRISAAALSGSSSGGAEFDAPANSIGSVNGFTNSGGGGFLLINGAALAVTGTIDAGTANLSITSPSLSFPGATLRAGTDVILSATGAVAGGTVNAGRHSTVTAASIDLASATAGTGALRLTANSGQLQLGSGSSGTTLELSKLGASGELQAISLTAGGLATINSSTSARLGSATSGGQLLVRAPGEVTGTGTGRADLRANGPGNDVTVDAGTLARLGTVIAADAVLVTADVIDTASATATAGALTMNADVGSLTLGTASSALDVDLRAVTLASLGSLSAPGRTVAIISNDLDIGTGLTAARLNITNAAGVAGTTRLGTVTGAGPGFSLTEAELNRITVPEVVIESSTQNVEIGGLALDSEVGSNALRILTTGRVDVSGRMSASGAGRDIQIGGTSAAASAGNPATLAAVIRVAATADGGGRLLFEGADLDLRATRIGMGQNAGFLDALGLVPGGTPITDEMAASDFVANPASTLFGTATGYSDPVVLRAGTLKVTYTNFAMFQNTAVPGAAFPTGAEIASVSVNGTLGLNSSGDAAPNSFALFGKINGTIGAQAALLGNSVLLLNGANRSNTRINGCLVASGGGGCLISAVAQPPADLFDSSQVPLRTSDDVLLNFDPVVGTNNEALFAGVSSIESGITVDCQAEPEAPECKTQTQDQQP